MNQRTSELIRAKGFAMSEGLESNQQQDRVLSSKKKRTGDEMITSLSNAR